MDVLTILPHLVGNTLIEQLIYELPLLAVA